MKIYQIFVLSMSLFIYKPSFSMVEYLCNELRKIGYAIEKVDNVPVIQRLTNILPFAITATALKNYPGQVIIILSTMIFYSIYNNKITKDYLKNSILYFKSKKEQSFLSKLDDDLLFIFEGEDEEDLLDEETIEDELLFEQRLKRQNKIIK